MQSTVKTHNRRSKIFQSQETRDTMEVFISILQLETEVHRERKGIFTKECRLNII